MMTSKIPLNYLTFILNKLIKLDQIITVVPHVNKYIQQISSIHLTLAWPVQGREDMTLCR